MRLALPLILVAVATSAAAAKPKTPWGSPYCAAPGVKPLFLSPMGEPFHGEPGKPYPAAAWAAGTDRNGDGRIDRVEFVADADRFFRTLDRSRDGTLQPEEIIAYERDVAPEISVYGPARGHGQFMPPDRRRPASGESNYGGPMGAGRYAWLNIPEPVAAADGDVDRIITDREFRTAAGRRFETLDPNGTGFLELAKMPMTPMQQSFEGPCVTRPKLTKWGEYRREEQERIEDGQRRDGGRLR